MQLILWQEMSQNVLNLDIIFRPGHTFSEVIHMAKQGMARPDWTHTHPKNSAPPVPQIQGKAKSGKEKAKPIIPETGGPAQKVFHERPISNAYRELDTDLARDNLENDQTFADLQDL